MRINVMQVFYDEHAYPFKDSARSVRYPVVGSAFMNASLTTEIRFYVGRITDNQNVTWVVNGKLPNGKLGHKVLNSNEDKVFDDELQEYYYAFRLSAFFTQVKGDLLISLSGYAGNIEYTYDVEQDTYIVYGSPTIQTTGTIKINIAYSTGVVDDNIELPFADFASWLSSKLNTIDGIIVLKEEYPNLSTYDDDIEDYSVGQFFYIPYGKFNGLYKKVEGTPSLVPVYSFLGMVYISNALETGDSIDPEDLEVINQKDFCLMWYAPTNELYIKNGIVQYQGADFANFIHFERMKSDDGINLSIPNKIIGVRLSNGEVSLGGDTYSFTKNEYTFKKAEFSNNAYLHTIMSNYGNTFIGTCNGKDYLIHINVNAEDDTKLDYAIVELKTFDYFEGTKVSSTIRFSESIATSSTQTINGEKHFLINPNTNNTTFDENDYVNKKYVDDEAAGVGISLQSHEDNHNNPHEVTKAQVGLGNVDNVKQVPISYLPIGYNKVAPLDNNSKLPIDYLPDAVLGQVEYCGNWNANSSTAQTIRTPRKGDYYVCSVSGTYDQQTGKITANYNPDGTPNGIDTTDLTKLYIIGDWAIYDGSAWEKIDNTDAVQSVNGKTGAVVLDKTNIGLGNVDNTSDLDKPISTATQTALDSKVSTLTLENYQSKFNAAPIVITADGWTQAVGGGYKKTITGQYSALGVVNNNDLVSFCAGGNTTSDIEYYGTLINQYGIQVLNVSTDSESGDTSIYLYARYQPQESINAFIGVLHYTYNPTENTALDISAVDNDTLEMVDSYLKIKFGSIAENNGKAVTGGDIYTALSGKQDNLTFDNQPTQNSSNPVKSGGVYTALEGKVGIDTTDYTVTNGSSISSELKASMMANKVVIINSEFYYPEIKQTTSTLTYGHTKWLSSFTVEVSRISISIGTDIATITEQIINTATPTAYYLHKISFSVSSKPYEIVIVSDRNSNYGDISTIISNKSGIVSLSNLMLYNLGGIWGLYNCFADSILDANIDSGSWVETITVL